MTDKELIETSYQWVRDLAQSGGRDWKLSVPVNLNKDPDILFCELGNRLKARNETIKQLQEEKERWQKVSSDFSDEIAELKTKAIELLQEENESKDKKLEFYRYETSKLREYLEVNRVGKPNQKLFDALYDHVSQQSETIKLLADVLRKAKTHVIPSDCVLREEIESVLEKVKPLIQDK